MPSRIRTAASPIFVAFLASVFSAAIDCSAAHAADDCLIEPKRQTPAGGHWYYRHDSLNHRKCWFLGDEGQKVVQSGLPRPSSSPPPLPKRPAAAIESSVADAHAELPKVATPTEPSQSLDSTSMSDPEKIDEVMPGASHPKTLSPPSESNPEAETRVISNAAINEQSRAELRTELMPGATDRQSAAELSAEKTAADLLGMPLAPLLIALGLSVIAGSLIFRLSSAEARNVFSSR